MKSLFLAATAALFTNSCVNQPDLTRSKYGSGSPKHGHVSEPVSGVLEAEKLAEGFRRTLNDKDKTTGKWRIAKAMYAGPGSGALYARWSVYFHKKSPFSPDSDFVVIVNQSNGKCHLHH